MEVVKYGRTTGLTYGTIVSRSNDSRVESGDQQVNFSDQFEVNSPGRGVFSQGGDSGSLIVAVKTKKAVGLLFAGADPDVTFANPVANVLQAFDVEIA